MLDRYLVIGAIALVVVALSWVVGAYNHLVRVRNLVQESWRQVDVELLRRSELIPNLVATVQGYAGHERSVLQSVTEARARVTSGGTVAERAAGENALSQSLRSMFAVAESYPELRASANFLSLQEELAATENRIAAARRFYNANVRDLNTRIEVFPSSLIAAAFRFRRADYFELDDTAQRIVPRVDLG